MKTEIHNILIIDDSEDYRKALVVRLNSLFPEANVVEYDFLAEGLPPDDFDWEKHDVLLLDYYLGGEETGINWYKKYHKTEDFPATIILTGLDTEEVATHVLKAGVHHYLSKTHLTKGDLFDGIEKAMQVRERRQLISSAKHKNDTSGERGEAGNLST